MRLSWHALLVLAGLPLVSSPALAFDCAKAASAVEKAICGDRGLRRADEAMGAAYTKLLRSAPDAGIREMLVASQRRWLQARDQWFDVREPGKDGLAGAIKDRTATLADASDKGLVARAQAQRAFLSKYSGGAFAGFNATCDFLPNDRELTSWSYGCAEFTAHAQNGNRVCSIQQTWATFAAYSQRAVSEIVDGKPKAVAYCDFSDREDSSCGDSAAQTRWNRNPAEIGDYPWPATGLPKLDAEVDLTDEGGWLAECLSAAAYPPPG